MSRSTDDLIIFIPHHSSLLQRHASQTQQTRPAARKTRPLATLYTSTDMPATGQTYTTIWAGGPILLILSLTHYLLLDLTLYPNRIYR